MARTATGSTAEMSAEKTKQSVVCSVYNGSTLFPSGVWTLPIQPIVTKPSNEIPINIVLEILSQIQILRTKNKKR
jgi:hypothetical protein